MTPEEKLNHLKDWMNCWTDCRVSTLMAIKNMLWLYKETGMMLSKGSSINVIPFDEYLQIIENKK